MTGTLVTLGSLGKFESGVGFPLELQGRTDGAYPFLKVSDISRHAKSGETYALGANHYVTEEDVAKVRGKLLPRGTVVFAKIGEAISQNFRILLSAPSLIDNNAMGYVPNIEKLDLPYLMQCLRLIDFYQLAEKTTVPFLRKSRLEQVKIPVPSLPEQRRIAAILDQAEALRNKRRQALVMLSEFSRCLFAEMFGRDLSRWSSVPLKDSLAVPLRNGLSPSKSGKYKGAVLTLSAVTGQRFDSKSSKEAMFATPPPVDQMVTTGDFLICRGNGNIGLVGKGYLATDVVPETLFPDTIIATRISSEAFDPQFFEYSWNAPFTRRQIEQRARTTNGTYKVNQTILEGIELPRPPSQLQMKFGDALRSVTRLRRTEDLELETITQLFSGLQQRAFRGEL